MTHSPDRHLIERGFPYDNNVVAIDCPKANLHAERCACGARTVRPYEQSLIDRMEAEYGIKSVADEKVRAAVLALTYDPAEREDIASGNVWPEVEVA